MIKSLFVVFVSTLLILSQFSFQSEESLTKKLDEPKKLKTEYIVLFIIDGPRYTETFGDTSYTLIPHLGKEMKKEGVLFTNFMNNGVTETISGHAAMMTGNYQSLKNNGTQLPKSPSFMQYYLKEKGAAQSSCWVISSKGKLFVVGDTRDKEWKNKFIPSRWCGLNGNEKDYVGDASTWVKIQEIFAANTPKLSMINLLAADANAHQKNWEGYRQGIKDCDEYVYKFWQMIQNNPKMKDKTTIFITNDHGRHLDGHKDGFAEHGDKCMGCKHISLLAIGPDFKKNVIIDKERELIDISKTISTMFNFSMPTTKGCYMNELFAE